MLCGLVSGVVLLVRVEVVDNNQYDHSPLPYRRLSLCTGTGMGLIVSSLFTPVYITCFHLFTTWCQH